MQLAIVTETLMLSAVGLTIHIFESQSEKVCYYAYVEFCMSQPVCTHVALDSLEREINLD